MTDNLLFVVIVFTIGFSKCGHFWEAHCKDLVIFRQVVVAITTKHCQSGLIEKGGRYHYSRKDFQILPNFLEFITVKIHAINGYFDPSPSFILHLSNGGKYSKLKRLCLTLRFSLFRHTKIVTV